jgi:hypothetical protein
MPKADGALEGTAEKEEGNRGGQGEPPSVPQ